MIKGMEKVYGESERIVTSREKRDKFMSLLKQNGICLFEYNIDTDHITIYEEEESRKKTIPQFLSLIRNSQDLFPNDCQNMIRMFQGEYKEPLEIRYRQDGKLIIKRIDVKCFDDTDRCLIGCIQDITEMVEREQILEKQAKTDSLTGLYNHFAGKELVNQYLSSKNPYASCGMMVVDIDLFKSVNDEYGHLFGDQVLVEFADLLNRLFRTQDILLRAGGDEFVIFLKDISHSELVKKAIQLTESVRNLSFREKDYKMTCSTGVCFLSENMTGYTYNQLFENADWALYKAKEYGRNQYVFCDNLQRFERVKKERDMTGIDARYLKNDLVATAFEIFEKTSSFDVAITLLLKIVGIRLELDRITIIQTNIRECHTTRQFQWRSSKAPEALRIQSSFTKEDFLTLFQSYDEHGTTVLQYDDMDMYSEQGRQLLMQGGAKTVVYAAMYDEGKYTGAISYVVCQNKRYWSRQNRKEIGELTKIITAYLTRYQMVNETDIRRINAPEYDSLTGLLSFTFFKEEVERKIVAGYTKSYVMVSTDFENFKYFNQKYTYSQGDQFLREFSSYVMGWLPMENGIYFCRVVADQFLIFFPYRGKQDITEYIQKLNETFIRKQEEKYPHVILRMRSGIYVINENCFGASEAIDSADFARKQVKENSDRTVCYYNEKLEEQQHIRNELINGMTSAMEKRKFKLYLQPKCSLEDGSIIGAEALVRLENEEGGILYPDQFISLYEANGRIAELDFYMFKRSVEFLAYCKAAGKRQIPISVNASVLLAKNEENVNRYFEVLEQYQVKPELLEIELTETTTTSNLEKVKCLFHRLRDGGIKTSLDDFGSGYSILNTIVDIPVDAIKLDRSLIEQCEKTEKGIYLLHHITSVFKGLGCQVICEGIETQEQAELMQKMGCNGAQGYLFAAPMPAEEFEQRYL